MISFGARSVGHYLSPIETFRLDLIAVGLVLGPYGLGLYFVGSTFGVLPRLLGRSLGAVAHPAIARADVTGEAGRLVLAVAGGAIAGLGVIAVLVSEAAPWLIGTLLGPDFLPAVPVVRVLQVAGFLMGLRAVLVGAAQGLGRPGADLVGELASLPVLAVGVAYALSRSDLVMVGAAIAAAYAVSCAVVAVVVARALHSARSGPTRAAASPVLADWPSQAPELP
jgi:O-antigen/teichoic acid export membrane protein